MVLPYQEAGKRENEYEIKGKFVQKEEKVKIKKIKMRLGFSHMSDSASDWIRLDA